MANRASPNDRYFAEGFRQKVPHSEDLLLSLDVGMDKALRRPVDPRLIISDAPLPRRKFGHRLVRRPFGINRVSETFWAGSPRQMASICAALCASLLSA